MKPIAILCSDLHLSLQQPACRADKDWEEVQRHYIQQLRNLQRSTGDETPVLCSGDIFDRWNASAELIHFALHELPDRMICIPGQHDLPNHSLEQIHRSGYGVLRKAGKIIDVSQGRDWKSGWLSVSGFGWDEKITPSPIRNGAGVQVALVHRYVWLGKNTCYTDAPEDSQFANFKSIFKSYDAVIIGDNHIPWETSYPGCAVINCGTFIRRKSDEIELRPGVGILYSDGSIVRRYLDTSTDRFHIDAKKREESAVDMKAFIEGLENLGEHGLNFREAIENHLRKEDLDKETKEIILQSLEDNKA